MNVIYINPRGISPKVFEGGSGDSIPLTYMSPFFITHTPLTHIV